MASRVASLPAGPDRPRGSWWAFVPVGLLGVLLTIQAVMVTLAVHDPGFALEPEYYQKASEWDQHQRQVLASERLSWRAQLTVTRGASGHTLTLRLVDAQGQPLQGVQVTLDYFHNARAAQRSQVTLPQVGAGTFAIDVSLRRPGLWVFQLQATRGSDVFRQELRADVF